MSHNKTRHVIPDSVVEDSIHQLIRTLHYRLEEKGKGTFLSSHEILGIVTEEYWELIEAVKTHGGDKASRIKDELMDIAVACVFGVACINEGRMDWL